jgi:tRNA pseudouridine55 synthase
VAKAELAGVLLVDKDPGPTSFDVVRMVRRAAHLKKVGHAGTLDPFASGLLPVCLGVSTRLVPYLMGSGKVYQATLRFGSETDTCDLEGAVVEEMPGPWPTVPELLAVLPDFVGDIEQRPPVYSAIRVDGRRAYDYARKGEDVEVPVRSVRIDRIDLLDARGVEVDIEVACGKGTYIRALARDIGRALGCLAHLTALRRTRVGGLGVEGAVRSEALADISPEALGRHIVSADDALAHLGALTVDDAVAIRLGYGQRVPADLVGGPIPEAPFRVLDPAGTLIALGYVDDGCIRVERGIVQR